MQFLLPVLLFVFGLGVGSFLNVVSLRYQPERNLFSPKIIGGRSHCPRCNKVLSWYELIPLFSFLIQKGKCRGCGQKISWQYPIVELLTGVVFTAAPLKIFNSQFSTLNKFSNLDSQFPVSGYELWAAGLWILIFTIFILLSVIDLRLFIIPNGLNLSLAFLGLGLILLKNSYGVFSETTGSFLGSYAMLAGFRENIWLNHFLAAASAMIFFGLIIVLSRGRAMGWGDFKLVGGLGLVFGWPDTTLVVALSFVLGALFSAPFLLSGRKKMKDAVPFGPFLVLAAGLVFFFGYYIMDGYFKLFAR